MIRLVVALSSEARPLIEHFDLRQGGATPGFRVFSGERASLVVTGIGKLNAAAGTAYLAGLCADQDRPWLNVGIAGHHTLAAGTGVYANRITDHASGRNWYPPKVIRTPGFGVRVTSYEEPVTDYPQDTACDMEASAFYPVATRFSPGEIVHCYKIISDNSTDGISGISAGSVTRWVGDHLAAIDSFAASLVELSGELPKRDLYSKELAEFKARWHFTVAQTVQLGEALRRMIVRKVPELMRISQWEHCASARHVLSEMESRLDSVPVDL